MSTSSTIHRTGNSVSPNLTACSLPSAEIEPIEIPPAATSATVQKTDAPMSEKVVAERVCLSTLFQRVYCPSLYSVMLFFFNHAKTLNEKQACLMYMLHYQRYNAEYTQEECHRLGYPTPLCFVQTQPGYFRTEFNRLFDLLESWEKKHLDRFLRLSFENFDTERLKEEAKELKKQEIESNEKDREPLVLKSIKICSSTAINVLKAFYSKEKEFQELETFCQALKGSKNEKILKESKEQKKNVILIRLTSIDLSKRGEEIIWERLQHISTKYKLSTIRFGDPQLSFLFLLQVNQLDVVFAWGASWAAPSKPNNDTLKYLRLEQVFDTRVFTLLNESGAAADRMQVNCFLASQVSGEEEFSSAIRKMGIPYSFEVKSLSIFPEPSLELWNQKMFEISQYKYIDDLGSGIYRDAILRWNREFFLRYDLLFSTAPLLHSQVYPWLSSTAGIVEWSKAYQNMCEIVMFCLQSFPEKFLDLNFESAILGNLDPEKKLKHIHQSVHLFPYAMSTIFHVFEHLLSQPGGVLRVDCINQNYFETLDLIQSMGSRKRVQSHKAGSLSEIRGEPDVLVADIHPNNAAKEKIFQNAVDEWVEAYLTSNPSKSLILILDITLNHLSDPLLQKMLERLVPFIEKGLLEIYGVQSLAKLYQLGADNFSGGVCIYLGNQNFTTRHPKFNSSCREKEAFFALLAMHFQDIARRYFALVRKNTDWMYHTLAAQLGAIEHKIRIYPTEYDRQQVFKAHEPYYGLVHNFCATQVALNGDENTVYVALSFKPLIDLMHESMVKRLQRQIARRFHQNPVNADVYEAVLKFLNGLKTLDVDAMAELRKKIESLKKGEKNENYQEILSSIRKAEEKQKEINNLVNKFRQLILNLAGNRRTPITGRQSFGFSLSNLSETVDALRFSIGAEKKEILNINAELVAEFSEILSLYIVENFSLLTIDNFIFRDKSSSSNDSKSFEAGVQKASDVLKQVDTTLAKVDLKETNYDEDGQEVLEKVGVVEIKIGHGRMTLKITRKVEGQEDVRTISSDKIYLQFEGIHCEQTADPNLASYENNGIYWVPMPRVWSTSDLIKLIYKLTCLNHDSVYVMEESTKNGSIYRICGVHETVMDFGIGESNVVDHHLDLKIEFKPFCLIDTLGKKFNHDQVFVQISDLGVVPVKLSRLGEDQRESVFTRCVTHKLDLKSHGEGCVQLIFKEQKFSIDYQKMVASIFFHKGGLPGVAEFLACPDLSDPLNLPLPKDYSWRFPKKPLDELYNALESLGEHLATTLTQEHVQAILTIKEKPYMVENHAYETCYRRNIFEGIFRQLSSMSLNQEKLNSETACAVAGVFNNYHSILSFHGEEIDHWIVNMNKKVKSCENLDWLSPYLVAFFPLICHQYNHSGALCDLEHSIPLRQLALYVRGGFPILWEYVNDLENQLSQYILRNIKLISLNSYMGLYARYPLSSNLQETLLAALRSVPNEIRNKWVVSADFYYDPLDHFHIGVAGDWDELVFRIGDQPLLQRFFEHTGCRDLLVKELKENGIKLVPKALRWAVMTQDEMLFSQLVETCKINSNNDEVLYAIGQCIDCLNLTINSQKELAKLVEK